MKTSQLQALSALLFSAAVVCAAHDAGLPASKCVIRVEGGQRIIEANGIPDHEPGAFPNRGNPNTIRAQRYFFRVPAKPQPAERPVEVDFSLFGIALNGVPFDPAAAEFYHNDRMSGWRYEALSGKVELGIDEHRAHVQPNGAYHYHGLPSTPDKTSGAGAEMKLAGWAADGFPIYALCGHDVAGDMKSPVRALKPSYRLKKGERPSGPNSPGGQYDGAFVQDWEYVAGAGDLDECNGRNGVTPEFPEGTYYYVLTEDYPFIPRLWRGAPSESFPRRGPPPGRPPRR